MNEECGDTGGYYIRRCANTSYGVHAYWMWLTQPIMAAAMAG
jgi:hypothetical protein